MLLPVPAVERRHVDAPNRAGFKASGIDAVAVRIGARDVKGFDAANRAKQVLRGAGVERIGGEKLRAAQQFEARFGDNEMKVAAFAADRAVALSRLDLGGRFDFELHPAAMTPAEMFDEAWVWLSQNDPAKLCSLFHLFRIAAAARRAVHLRAVIENLLRRGDVGVFAFPGLERRILQRARIGEAHLPRMRAKLVHGVEMLGGAHRALTAGQKSDARYRRRHGALQTLNRSLRDLFNTGLARIVFA